MIQVYRTLPTFEGITWASSFIENHKLWSGYLVRQKLRDHNNFHHLFADDDGAGEYDKWRENDDTVALDGKKKLNSSYTDIRFELNYLF